MVYQRLEITSITPITLIMLRSSQWSSLHTIYAYYIALGYSASSDFKPIIPYLQQTPNLPNKSNFNYKRPDSQPRNANALLLPMTLSLIAVLYTSKTIGLPLYRNANAKTLSQYAVRMQLRLVIEEPYAKTSLPRTNISPNELEEHILHLSVNRKLHMTYLQRHKLRNCLKRT